MGTGKNPCAGRRFALSASEGRGSGRGNVLTAAAMTADPQADHAGTAQSGVRTSGINVEALPSNRGLYQHRRQGAEAGSAQSVSANGDKFA